MILQLNVTLMTLFDYSVKKGDLFRTIVTTDWCHKGDVYIVDTRNGFHNQLFPIRGDEYRNGNFVFSGMPPRKEEFEKL